MKKNLTRALAMLLLFALVLLPFASCSSGTENASGDKDAAAEGGQNTADASSDPEADATADAEEERIKPDIPETADFGGDEIYFVVWELSSWADTVRQFRDIYAEELTGEAINDAVYNRNALVETNYNVKITQERMDIGAIDGALSKAVTAGDTTYDVVYPRLYEAAGMYQKNYFHNLLNVPHIDFDKPWWDSNCADSLSCMGILLCAATSINVNDKDATAAMAFSKQEAENYGLEDLYTAVREGRWTFDMIAALSEQCTRDSNGDGTITYDDFYGFLGKNDVMTSFWHGGGGLLCSKDEDGAFAFTFGTERDIDVAVKVVNMMQQTWFFNQHLHSEVDDTEFTELFETGHGLFFWMRLDEVTNMRNGDTDFGILPTPKYEEAQDKYYSFVSQHTTGLMSIPITISGDALDELGMVLEAMAAESHYTLIPEYIELSLKTKHARDQESGDMLDIIINNRIFDPMEIYNFGGFANTFMGYGPNNTTDIASNVQKSSKVITKTIDKMVKKLLEDNGG